MAPESRPDVYPAPTRAPDRPLYVLRIGEEPGEDGPQLVTDAGELHGDLRVASSESGPFVPIRDAIDQSPEIRDALLSMSPEPALERWRKLRSIALAAPVSWSVFVASQLKEVRELSTDARRVIESPAFKAAELEPATAAATKARRTKIERAVTMRTAYAGIEAAVGVAALVVLIAGFRRFRAIPIAIGAGAGIWWLFHAGMPDRCFGPKAYRELFLAWLGLGGALAALLLAPSETKIARGLRRRLGLEPAGAAGVPDPRGPGADRDLIATLAAAWAGVALPFLLRWLGTVGLSDLNRAAFFVLFCLAAFLGFLAWRKDESVVPPRFRNLAIAAVLGFGVTTAADVASRSSLATVIAAQTCIAPESAAKLKGVQESSAKETTAARKETQTQALAFWIAILAAPISEEMLYRGTLQRVARRRLGARWAIVLSGVVFGIAHALAFPAAFYQHFGLGLAFASVFELAGGGAVGVVASAATHAMWNAWLAGMPVF